MRSFEQANDDDCMAGLGIGAAITIVIVEVHISSQRDAAY